MQSSPCRLIDFGFHSSQPPPTPMLQWLLDQARAWPQTASPMGLLGKSKLGLFKMEEGHWFKEMLYTNRCVEVFLDQELV